MHWLTFRKTCERLLPPEEFIQVRDLFDSTLWRASRWFADKPAVATVSRTTPELLTRLRRMIPRGASFDETLTILSAVACALWEQEWHLHCTLDKLAAAVDAKALPPLDRQRCAAIATETSPDRSAAAVLALLAPEVALTGLHTLNLEHIAPDGSTITITGVARTVPEFARWPLRAQLHYRRNEGAKGHDPFIPRRGRRRAHIPQQRHSRDSWAKLLTDTGKWFGLVLNPRSMADQTTAEWSRRYGIRITPFASRLQRLLGKAA